jgi:hypothetical protein
VAEDGTESGALPNTQYVELSDEMGDCWDIQESAAWRR